MVLLHTRHSLAPAGGGASTAPLTGCSGPPGCCCCCCGGGPGPCRPRSSSSLESGATASPAHMRASVSGDARAWLLSASLADACAEGVGVKGFLESAPRMERVAGRALPPVHSAPAPGAQRVPPEQADHRRAVVCDKGVERDAKV